MDITVHRKTHRRHCFATKFGMTSTVDLPTADASTPRTPTCTLEKILIPQGIYHGQPGAPDGASRPLGAKENSVFPRTVRGALRPVRRPWTPGFAGRAADLTTVDHLLGDGNRVVSIVGPPGAGKSSLALRVAHDHRDQFPDGQLFAQLRTPSCRRRC
jgi:hypothetical protein